MGGKWVYYGRTPTHPLDINGECNYTLGNHPFMVEWALQLLGRTWGSQDPEGEPSSLR